MSEQIRQMVDPDDRLLDQVRFGRNRFLRAAGAALFGLAVRMALPRQVYAHHLDGSPPEPCYGYHTCPNCNGTECYPDCWWHEEHAHGCPTEAQCWVSCSGFVAYWCCDWHHPPEGPHDYCICRGYIGNIC